MPCGKPKRKRPQLSLRPKSREETPKEGSQTGNKSAPSNTTEFSVQRTINKCKKCMAAIPRHAVIQ
jgi:hypothetical protein